MNKGDYCSKIMDLCNMRGSTAEEKELYAMGLKKYSSSLGVSIGEIDFENDEVVFPRCEDLSRKTKIEP